MKPAKIQEYGNKLVQNFSPIDYPKESDGTEYIKNLEKRYRYKLNTEHYNLYISSIQKPFKELSDHLEFILY